MYHCRTAVTTHSSECNALSWLYVTAIGHTYAQSWGDSVAEWLACWTQAQKGPGSNLSHDAAG